MTEGGCALVLQKDLEYWTIGGFHNNMILTYISYSCKTTAAFFWFPDYERYLIKCFFVHRRADDGAVLRAEVLSSR